ncbi:small subunit ribosomal protein S18e [Enteropsectra breve]|nr:small subunit ribosomal protein S18e [Enteropsectra breve]KAI5150811.1 small subunit ribosomal protein S18e [Enteropsectra breve]
MAAAKTAAFDKADFQHIIRLYNTNIDGNKKTPFAMTKIRGIGKRFAKVVVARAGVSVEKRAGELTQDEIQNIQNVIADPVSFGIPVYMLNHQKDIVDGTDSQLVGIKLDADLRMHTERGKKMKEIRVMRLAAGLKVRGQKTKSNGRKGKNLKVHKKK